MESDSNWPYASGANPKTDEDVRPTELRMGKASASEDQFGPDSLQYWLATLQEQLGSLEKAAMSLQDHLRPILGADTDRDEVSRSSNGEPGMAPAVVQAADISLQLGRGIRFIQDINSRVKL